ncbi:hypothetical protein VTN02DRAFT_898 [Thermoascus thermophilus]
MGDTTVNSYHDIVRQRTEQFEAALQRGEWQPLLLHHFLIGFFLLFLPLSIPHKSRVPGYICFLLLLSWGFYTFARVRALTVANGYCVGLFTSWWLIWGATLLVFNDAQKDFKRIERTTAAPVEDGRAKDVLRNKNEAATSNGSTIRHRQAAAQARTEMTPPESNVVSPEQEVLRWQPFPDALSHRCDWVLNAIFSYRGAGWNWRIQSLPPLPPSVRKQLDEGVPVSDESDESATIQASRNCLKRALFRLLWSYIALDIIKVTMMRDRYFWGDISNPPPPPFPFSFLAGSPLSLRIYRLLLTGFGIFAALNYVTSSNPIICLGLSLAFPRFARSLTKVPLDAAWLYPDQFGPFVPSVLDHGLAGCWGGWWHQIFRFGFSSVARWLTSCLPERLGRHTNTRRVIEVLVSFAVSGLIHAAGSWCQLASTSPFPGSFFFFAVQGPGVLAQRFIARQVLPKVLPFSLPRWLRRATNATVVFFWFLFTGPYLVDDFSKGGLWLMEPVPVSFVRALGFGDTSHGWWSLCGPWIGWWSGETWWQSGIRII